MTERREAEELGRATREMADAAMEMSRAVAFLAELEARSEQSNQRLLENVERLVMETREQTPVSEQDAVHFAVRSVREVRGELWADRELEASPPNQEDIERWEADRSEVRDRAGYEIS